MKSKLHLDLLISSHEELKKQHGLSVTGISHLEGLKQARDIIFGKSDHIPNIEGKIIYVDIDQTLCISETRSPNGELDYNYSIPIDKNIDTVNKLFEKNTIVLYTARGKRTKKIDWSKFTLQQIKEWGIKYHAVEFRKPHFDLLIDDKAITNFEQLNNYFDGTEN